MNSDLFYQCQSLQRLESVKRFRILAFLIASLFILVHALAGQDQPQTDVPIDLDGTVLPVLSFFPEATDLGANQYSVSGFGSFDASNFPIIDHEEHGKLLVDGINFDTGMWLYDTSLGWIWRMGEWYYQDQTATWLFYLYSDGIRYFYNSDTSEWLEIPESSYMGPGGNSPPKLEPIDGITVTELNSVSLTVTASDTDMPPQPLTYSLENAPSGAFIDSTTGEFSWTPTEAQSPGVYAIKVIVSDGSFQDWEYINITVNERPLPTHTVTFDLDGKGSRTGGGALNQTVSEGSAATAPQVTADAGWSFDGWDTVFSNITSDLVVTAQYKVVHTVTFELGSHGTASNPADLTQEIIEGEAAVAPVFTVESARLFKGWDQVFSNVTEDIIVTAQYVFAPTILSTNSSVSSHLNWLYTAGTINHDDANRVAIAADGSIYISGCLNGYNSGHISKLDADGKLVWQQTLTGNVWISGLEVAPDGSLLVGMRLNGVVAYASQPMGAPEVTSGAVLRLDSNGNILNLLNLSGNTSNGVFIASSVNGFYAAYGTTVSKYSVSSTHEWSVGLNTNNIIHGATQDQSGIAVIAVDSSSTPNVYKVYTVDSDQSTELVKTFDYPFSNENEEEIVVSTSSNNLYLIGNYGEAYTLGSHVLSESQSFFNDNVFIANLSDTGTFNWARSFGSEQSIQYGDAIGLIDDQILVTGFSYESAPPNLGNIGLIHFWTESGNIIDSIELNAQTDDDIALLDLALGQNNELVFAGFNKGTVTIGDVSKTSMGERDMMVGSYQINSTTQLFEDLFSTVNLNTAVWDESTIPEESGVFSISNGTLSLSRSVESAPVYDGIIPQIAWKGSLGENDTSWNISADLHIGAIALSENGDAHVGLAVGPVSDPMDGLIVNHYRIFDARQIHLEYYSGGVEVDSFGANIVDETARVIIEYSATDREISVKYLNTATGSAQTIFQRKTDDWNIDSNGFNTGIRADADVESLLDDTITADNFVIWESSPATNTNQTNHTVTFDLAGNGTYVGGGALTQQVEHGGSAIEPAFTNALGWQFIGWDKDFTNVTNDLTVTAQYERYYTVIFNLTERGTHTGGGDLLQSVVLGHAPVVPQVTAVTGWIFTGWDTAFDSVTADLTITALYSENEDEDDDSIPDIWEIQHFGAITVADRTTDFDDDGKLDYHEFLAGTGPANGSDYLRILSLSFDRNLSEMTLLLSTTDDNPNRRYKIWYKLDLGNPEWLALPSGEFAPEAGDSTRKLFTFPDGSDAYFFKVESYLQE